MKIKTTYWEETRRDMWVNRIEKLFWIMGILALANLIYYVLTNNILLIIINLFPFITSLLSQFSVKKYRKEQRIKEEQENKI